jgi:hypothetical protein
MSRYIFSCPFPSPCPAPICSQRTGCGDDVAAVKKNKKRKLALTFPVWFPAEFYYVLYIHCTVLCADGGRVISPPGWARKTPRPRRIHPPIRPSRIPTSRTRRAWRFGPVHLESGSLPSASRNMHLRYDCGVPGGGERPSVRFSSLHPGVLRR